jgi:hypothetical protein
MKFIYNILSAIVSFLSFEFLLTKFRWANGGTVIFIRTSAITLLLYFLYISIVQGLDPARTSEYSGDELKKAIVNSIEVFGAIYAAIYIALYSRFSAQWSYLSNLYNQIKVVEASPASNPAIINDLKAAFVEDAIALHLSKKPMFAMIIKSWGHDPAVKALIEHHMKDGVKIYNELMKDIDEIIS